MRAFAFYLICLIPLLFFPIISSTSSIFIDENEQMTALKPNPIVVEKLLEKLSKYQNQIIATKDNIFHENLFENRDVLLKSSKSNKLKKYHFFFSLMKQITTFLGNPQIYSNILYSQHLNKKE